MYMRFIFGMELRKIYLGGPNSVWNYETTEIIE